MEGYVIQHGHVQSHRHYWVLEGSMITSYASKNDADSISIWPASVHEIAAVEPCEGRPTTHHWMLLRQRTPVSNDCSFRLWTLAKPDHPLHLSLASSEEAQAWIETIQEALGEPLRLVQEEVQELVQEHQEVLEHAQHHKTQAKTSIQEAQDQVRALVRLKQEERHLHLEWTTAKRRRETLVELVHAATEAQARAQAQVHQILQGPHDGEEDSRRQVAETASEKSQEVSQLSHDLTVHEAKMDELSSKLVTCQEAVRMQTKAAEACRAKAALTLSEAHMAKDKAGNHPGVAPSPDHHSQVDALAEGYLSFKPQASKNKTRVSGHALQRKYFVLFGKTLSYFTNADAYEVQQGPSGCRPLGVYHLLRVSSWSGQMGLRIFPHAFAIETLEGKTLYCSGSVPVDVHRWTTAIQLGVTMSPMSPTHAILAKRKRYQLQLQLQSARTVPAASAEEAKKLPSPIERGLLPTEIPESNVKMEGYLMKKGHFIPRMGKYYCVLHELTLTVYHHQVDTIMGGEILGTLVLKSVTEWNGHTPLMQYDHGFEIQTLDGHHVHCSAYTAKEKHQWIDAFEHTMAVHKHPVHSFPIQMLTCVTSVCPEQTQDDVDRLLELYFQHEERLLASFDEVMGTSLAQNHDLLASISSYHAESKNKTRPRMEGLLVLHHHLTRDRRVYAVLQGSSLVLYESQKDVLLKPRHPLECLEIVHFDHWTPSTSFLTHTSSSEHQAGLSIMDISGKVVHVTTELKQEWIVTLRRGEGRAYLQASTHASHHKDNHNHCVPIVRDFIFPHLGLGGSHDDIREVLVDFYTKRNPDFLNDLDVLLGYFGDAQELRVLLELLDQVYPTSGEDDVSATALCTHPVIREALDDADLRMSQNQNPKTIHQAGYLRREHTSMLHPQLKREYFELRDTTTLVSFANYREAKLGTHEPHVLTTVVDIAEWNTHHHHHAGHPSMGFVFLTKDQGRIQVVSTTEEERQSWIKSTQRALAQEPTNELKEDQNSGYLDIKFSGPTMKFKERFGILNDSYLKIIHVDEADTPGIMLSISQLFEYPAEPELGFQCQTNQGRIAFRLPTTELKHWWISSVRKMLNRVKGRALIQDQVHQQNPQRMIPEADIEGTLEWKKVGAEMMHPPTFVAIVEKHIFRLYSSQSEFQSFDILSLKSLEPQEFQLELQSKGERRSPDWYTFKAKSAHDVEHWTAVIQEALDHGLSVMAGHESKLVLLVPPEPQAEEESTPAPIRHQGDVCVTHRHYFTRKRDCVCTLSTSGQLEVYPHDDSQNPNEPKCRSRVVNFHPWHGTDVLHVIHFGLALDTASDGTFYCEYQDALELSHWTEALKLSLIHDQEPKAEEARASSSLSDVRMEGYLKKRVDTTAWIRRYAILCGTQLLEYESQARAHDRSHPAPVSAMTVTGVQSPPNRSYVGHFLHHHHHDTESQGKNLRLILNNAVEIDVPTVEEKHKWKTSIELELEQESKGVEDSFAEAQDKTAAVAAVKARVAQVKTENDRIESQISHLLDLEDSSSEWSSQGSDHSEEEPAKSNPVPRSSHIIRQPRPCFNFTMCWNRNPVVRKQKVVSFLSPEQAQLYRCEYYALGSKDLEL